MMKNKRKFKILFAAIMVFVLASGLTVSASWYGRTSATFSTSLAGAGRYYDGNNVGLDWSNGTHNSNPNHISTSNGFNVSLERKGFLGIWQRIGTVNKSRSGSGGANWTNVGPGTYRFYFSKSNDGTTQYVTDIEMYSW